MEGMQCQISEKMSRVVCFQQCRTENIKINKITVVAQLLMLSLLLNFGTDHETYTLSSVGIYVAHLFRKLKFNLFNDIGSGVKELYCSMF